MWMDKISFVVVLYCFNIIKTSFGPDILHSSGKLSCNVVMEKLEFLPLFFKGHKNVKCESDCLLPFSNRHFFEGFMPTIIFINIVNWIFDIKWWHGIEWMCIMYVIHCLNYVMIINIIFNNRWSSVYCDNWTLVSKLS